ncbi:hypothetical protein J2752_001588 [Halarchaeum rubridurum]|uniref:Uncharacterized protein n=1 Tax=Halarchaeum rubridurum TaxID=489911 RepID=A0A8T4GM08_9EURY|nr:hypothetical protein [Halarchaeum rubridurum]
MTRHDSHDPTTRLDSSLEHPAVDTGRHPFTVAVEGQR